MPIESFPVEIWEEIFEWLYTDVDVPIRGHALVCTQWRQILLNLPILWRKIEINPARQGSPEAIHDQLERRIHHARNSTLDVTFSKVPNNLKRDQVHYIGLLKHLARLGPIDRWQSLSIFDETYHHSDLVPHDIFTGRFTSLRALTILGLNSTFRPYSGLFNLITLSNPPLNHLNIQAGGIPPELVPLARLPTITTVCGTLESLDMMLEASPPRLRQITLDGRWYDDPEMSVSKEKYFPKCHLTIIHYRPSLVWALKADNVTSLQIDGLVRWDKLNVFLQLPSLDTLQLCPCKPQFLQVFRAPHLQVLKLSRGPKWGGGLPLKVIRRENRAYTITLFQRRRYLLTSYPTSLIIDLEEITDGALVVMLEAWPQLKRLSITLGRDFDCFSVFYNHLLHPLSPLCPQLETLDMEVWWYAQGRNWRRWRAVAEKMMSKRVDALERITWRNKWFGVETVTRDSIARGK